MQLIPALFRGIGKQRIDYDYFVYNDAGGEVVTGCFSHGPL